MGAGRPTKLNPKITATICRSIRSGNYLETAASLAGVSKTTLYLWLRKGARARYRQDGEPYEADRPYVEFSHSIEKAQAEAVARDLSVIDGAAQGGRVATVTKKKYVKQRGEDGKLRRVLAEETIEKRVAAPEWQAAAWRLERRNPEMFGRRRPKEFEPDEIDLDGLSDEALQRIADGEDINTVLADEGGGGNEGAGSAESPE